MTKLNGIFPQIYNDFIKQKTLQDSVIFPKPVELVIVISGAAALGKTFFSENFKCFLESHGLSCIYI